MDDLKRLSWVIGEVEKLTVDGHVDTISEETIELFWVATSLLNTALTQAKGIRTLIAADLFDAAGPLERALWELWNDFNYLFKYGDRRINAQKILINAHFELLSFFEAGSAGHAAHRSTLESALRDYENEWPQAFGEVQQQRQRRRYHWSGLSHSAVERILSPGSTTYKALSWEAHAVLAPLKGIDIHVGDDVATLRFERYQDAFADPARMAWSTGAVLYYIWNAYAKQWGLSLLEPPDAISPMAGARRRLVKLLRQRQLTSRR